jgi:integrase/recombinase XerD
MDWSEAIDALMRGLRRLNLKLPTITAYRAALEDFATRMQRQGVGLRQVKREHIEEHQGALLKRKLKPRTVAQRIQALRRLFEHLTDTGQLLLDPTEGTVALKTTRPLPRRQVTEAEMKKLLAAPNTSLRIGIRDRAVLEMLYGTAMRAGEMLALEVADVDLELGLARIRKGKGHKELIVPMGRNAQAWVREYAERVRPWWMQGKAHERRMFMSQAGRSLSRGALHQVVRRHSLQAGLTPIYPHAIRHAAATHMLRAGADIRAVQKLLGHARLTTTQIYTHVSITDVERTHARTHPLGASGP